MPKGVYARKSAQPKKSARKARPRAKARVAPKPSAAPQLSGLLVTPAAELAQPQVYTRADFRRPIDTMGGPLLKAYARSIGILQRDVDHLTEDRLRQNCKARVLATYDD